MSPDKRIRILERALQEAQQDRALEQSMKTVFYTADVEQQYGAEARQQAAKSRSSVAVLYGDSMPRANICASTSVSSLRSAKSLANSYTVLHTSPPPILVTSINTTHKPWQELKQDRPTIRYN